MTDSVVEDELDALEEFFATEDETEFSEAAYGERTDMVRAGPNVVELLSFWVADEEYAVPIVQIGEIIKIPPITELPRVHRAVLGIISLRGTIVPLLDLRIVLGLEEGPTTRQSRILVLQGDGDPIGLLVDRVTSVVRLNKDTIEPAPRGGVSRVSGEILQGVGRIQDRLLIVLDVAGVMGVMEQTA